MPNMLELGKRTWRHQLGEFLKNAVCFIAEHLNIHVTQFAFICLPVMICIVAFSAFTLLVGRQEEHLACKN